jgi:hypothetical protein
LKSLPSSKHVQIYPKLHDEGQATQRKRKKEMSLAFSPILVGTHLFFHLLLALENKQQS